MVGNEFFFFKVCVPDRSVSFPSYAGGSADVLLVFLGKEGQDTLKVTRV